MNGSSPRPGNQGFFFHRDPELTLSPVRRTMSRRALARASQAFWDHVYEFGRTPKTEHLAKRDLLKKNLDEARREYSEVMATA